jgi:hypothetical protein
MEHQPTARRAGVDCLGDRLQCDASRVQILDGLDELPQ